MLPGTAAYHDFLFHCYSEAVYTKPGSPRPVVIPKYRAVPIFVIKNNLRTAGISRERYFQLLTECR